MMQLKSCMNTTPDTNFSRLREFIRLCYKDSIPEFAKVVGMKYQQVERYCTDNAERQTMPGGEALIKFAKAGLNTQWLLVGEGGMFAANDVGRQLYRTVTGKDAPPMVDVLEADTRETIKMKLTELQNLLVER
jgi:hypothetical protein